ncbi:MAG: VOC family protein [Oscillospiraceae bacterium]|nr:VOC family protein [Oscillospiraceae bacterium]
MIHHVAVWVSDLEKMKDFYVKYFNGTSNTLYHNPKKEFWSYFVTFQNGSKLELMKASTVSEGRSDTEKQFTGYTHIAFSTGSAEDVDKLTSRLTGDGYRLANGPRTTGDGFYESCVFDPEGNRVEITV